MSAVISVPCFIFSWLRVLVGESLVSPDSGG
jgi:hypothetical protein